MNVIQDFFKRHHAVRSDDRGVDWGKASNENLINWLIAYAQIANGWNKEIGRESTEQERKGVLPMLQELCNECELRWEADKSPENAAVGATYFVYVLGARRKGQIV
jgi:hypothetical protein